MARVARFNIAPVKSTSLHHPDAIDLRRDGAAGDHRFLVLETDGTRLSGEAKKPLLGIRADYDPGAECLTLVIPEGPTLEGDASANGDRIEVALFDRSVTARMVHGPLAQALSERLGREVHLARVDKPEYAGGRHRVSLLSLASVRDLGVRGGANAMPDPRRFRMLIELDECEPYEEDAWSGRVARIGDAHVAIGDGVPRCSLTTLDPDTGEKDYPTLDVLATYRRRSGDLPLGVYADVVQEGRIRVGDALGLL